MTLRPVTSILFCSLALTGGAEAAPQEGKAVAPAPIVCRGDHVVLRAVVGLVTGSVEAEALEDGRAGQVIRVRNLQSRRTQLARVVAPGQVEVAR